MMSTLSLDKVKKIDTKTKYIVERFVRDAQELMPKDITYFIIPQLIVHWILLYYFMAERFDENNYDEFKYKLLNDNLEIKQINSHPGSVYLTQIAKSGIHKWTFKLLFVNPSIYYMTIGVFKMNHEMLPYKTSYEYVGDSYGWIVNYRILTRGDGNRQKMYGAERKCVTNDTVVMTLDLDKKTLRYAVNGKDFGVAFKGIADTEYKAVVSTNSKKDSIAIVAYEHVLSK